MSKDVLETLLILDFKAQGRGRRFQYATYGPPAPEGGRTIKEYAVRLAPAAGPEGSAPPTTLVLSLGLTFALVLWGALDLRVTKLYF